MSFLAGLKTEKSDLATLTEMFHELDTDQNGFLSLQEITEGMSKLKKGFRNMLGKNPNWEQLFESIDTDNSG